MPIQEIPLHTLTLSDLNVRKTRSKEDIEAMARSIEAEGLLQNLLVHPTDKGFAVVIGGTRLEAMKLLLKEGKIAADFPVMADVRPANDASLTAKSLAENFRRTSMHPVEEFRAFDAMRQQGRSNEEIAASEGTTLRHVEQRLKLATVSPKLIDIAHRGEMTMAQLMSFTLSDSHKTQERTWRELPEWAKQQRNGEAIRDQLTEKHIPADSRLVKFVGLEAYRDAGGNVIGTLFDQMGAGYITEPKVLNRMVDQKLKAEAEPLRSQGWKWLDVRVEWGWQDQEKLKTTMPSLTKEQLAEIKGYAAEQERILEGCEDPEGDLTQAEQQKYDDLEGQIAVVRSEAGFTLAQKAISGVVVTISRDGELEIRRGLVKPEDVKELRKLERGEDKPKPNGKGDHTEKSQPGISAALLEELTAHRTLAMQAKLAGNAKVAMAALAHAILSDGEGSVLQVRIQQPNLSVIGDKTPAAKELAAAIKEATKGMPRDSAKQLAWLLQQNQTRLATILGAAVAPSLNAVERKFNGADRKAADQLAQALKVDMSEFWTATADNFFSRVSKDQGLAAVTEAAGEEAAKKLSGLKKSELAVAADKAVRGKGWIPSVLANG